MSDMELIDFNPLTKMETYLVFDDSEPTKFRIHHRQPVAALLDQNVDFQNDNDYKKKGIKIGWHHVAHIPDIVQMQWMKEGIDVMNRDHLPAVLRKLRDPQFRKLRTTLGKI